MNELDVERALVVEWQAVVGADAADRDLAVTILETHGRRMTRALLWAELEDARLAFGELRASLGTSSAAETLATPRWTVKDVIGHVASWATELVRQIETIAAHEEFDYVITFTPRVGPTEWNARELERRAGTSLDDRFRELDDATVRAQELVLSLPDEVLYADAVVPQTPDGRQETRWRTRPADFIVNMCGHYRYHLDRINDVLA